MNKRLLITLSSIVICSSALFKIGTNKIASFDVETTEVKIAVNFYPSPRGARLSSYSWNFAAVQVQLVKILAELDGRGRGVEDRINERWPYTNAASLVLTYLVKNNILFLRF